MGDKGTNSTPTAAAEQAEDFRVTQARQVLEETAIGRDTYGEAVGQVLALRSALAGLLNCVAEGTHRDRVHISLVDALETVSRSLGVKVSEVERLTGIEQRLERMDDLLTSQVETLVNVLGRAADGLDRP